MFTLRSLLLAGAFAAVPMLAAEKFPKPERVVTAATPAQRVLILEGVALHDLQSYDGAIAKYKQVLAENPWEVNALHELAYSYFESKRYQETIATARLGAQCQSKLLPFFHVMIANALDELGKGKEAIETYKAAIKQNPSVGLVHFNLAISLRRAGKLREAKAAVERALQCDPAHASSHLTLGVIYRDMGYRTPAVLAYSRFLVLEPGSQRAIEVLPILRGLLSGGAKQGKQPGQVTIFVPNMPKRLKDEGDFSSVEMMISLHAASGLIVKPGDEIKKPTTAFEQLVTLYSGIAEALELSKSKSGFAATYYAPYFSALAKAGYTEAFVGQAWKAGKLEGAAEWMQANEAKLEAFRDWSKAYQWPDK